MFLWLFQRFLCARGNGSPWKKWQLYRLRKVVFTTFVFDMLAVLETVIKEGEHLCFDARTCNETVSK